MANVVIPDAELVHNYINGDENALSILIKRHQSKIYGLFILKLLIGISPMISFRILLSK